MLNINITVKLRGWATISENLDKNINCRLNTDFQKNGTALPSPSPATCSVSQLFIKS